MTPEQRLNCIKSAKVYGNAQIGLCMEECAELIQALSKVSRLYEGQPVRLTKVDVMNNVLEEMADVLIMIEQMKYILSIEDEDISKMIDKKLDR